MPIQVEEIFSNCTGCLHHFRVSVLALFVGMGCINHEIGTAFGGVECIVWNVQQDAMTLLDSALATK